MTRAGAASFRAIARFRFAQNGTQNIQTPPSHRSSSVTPVGRNSPSLVQSPPKNDPSWIDSIRSDRRYATCSTRARPEIDLYLVAVVATRPSPCRAPAARRAG